LQGISLHTSSSIGWTHSGRSFDGLLTSLLTG
jgi:hypothetical protein